MLVSVSFLVASIAILGSVNATPLFGWGKHKSRESHGITFGSGSYSGTSHVEQSHKEFINGTWVEVKDKVYDVNYGNQYKYNSNWQTQNGHASSTSAPAAIVIPGATNVRTQTTKGLGSSTTVTTAEIPNGDGTVTESQTTTKSSGWGRRFKRSVPSKEDEIINEAVAIQSFPAIGRSAIVQ